MGHDSTSRIQALDRAQSYGTELLTGIYFHDPNPPPTLGSLVRERQESLRAGAPPRERILEMFVQR
jgi:2-oxoglutarate ferredoxin oxidoreductase subunit beta